MPSGTSRSCTTSFSRERSCARGDLAADAAAARGVGHQHRVAAGEREIGGQRRALVAALFLDDLHQHHLAALDDFLDLVLAARPERRAPALLPARRRRRRIRRLLPRRRRHRPRRRAARRRAASAGSLVRARRAAVRRRHVRRERVVVRAASSCARARRGHRRACVMACAARLGQCSCMGCSRAASGSWACALSIGVHRSCRRDHGRRGHASWPWSSSSWSCVMVMMIMVMVVVIVVMMIIGRA